MEESFDTCKENKFEKEEIVKEEENEENIENYEINNMIVEKNVKYEDKTEDCPPIIINPAPEPEPNLSISIRE